MYYLLPVIHFGAFSAEYLGARCVFDSSIRYSQGGLVCFKICVSDQATFQISFGVDFFIKKRFIALPN